MPSNEQSVNVTFPKDDTELYQWVISQNQMKPLAWIGREAFECLRLCKYAFGDSWQAKLEEVIANNMIDSIISETPPTKKES